MSRLTKKRLDDDSIKFVFGDYECGVIFDKSMTEEDKQIYLEAEYPISVMNKLGRLEDIEQEIGIDLITLFKALKQGYIWYDEEKYKIECIYMKPQIHLYVADGVGSCYMKDYGKTWALTKEELLNGR